MTSDEYYMRLALQQAKIAASLGEVPVGAVIVRKGKIISAAYNRRELDKNALAHAEILAINSGCKEAGGWRLFDSCIYVTLEPCPMCAGAILNARIDRVVYSAPDPKAGSLSSVMRMYDCPYNHIPEITGGILADESAKLLKDFFKKLRKEKSDKHLPPNE